MPDSGRSPSKPLVYALALPIIALAYVTTFSSRLWAALRPTVATFLGATVIASVYGEVAYRRTPTPVRAAGVLLLSLSLVGQNLAAPPSVAAADPAARVVAAARDYLGSNYKLGTEGPRTFDCSGLIYRAFADAGELPRIGGMRLLARGYKQYFVSRGRFSTRASDARLGDLIVYDDGKHIGIYVGDGKVLSALVQPWGVMVHRMTGIDMKVTHVLEVNWGGGDGGNGNGGGDNGGGGNGGGGNGGGGGGGNDGGGDNLGRPGASNGNDSGSAPDPDNGGGNGGGGNDGGEEQPNNPGSSGGGQPIRPDNHNAVALGTMNLRTDPDPNARIIGWVGRNGTFRVIGEGVSPAGYPWFRVETRSGKTGWVYARWVRTT